MSDCQFAFYNPLAAPHLSVSQRWTLVYDGLRARDFRIDYVTEENPFWVVELSLDNCADLPRALCRHDRQRMTDSVEKVGFDFHGRKVRV
jgi:hypothetical protein